jgi:hypothetical protein
MKIVTIDQERRIEAVSDAQGHSFADGYPALALNAGPSSLDRRPTLLWRGP